MSFFASETESRMLIRSPPKTPASGMSRVIEKHKYWRKVTSVLSANNPTRFSLANIELFIARQLERSAKRRLIRLEPATCEEAKEKVLYLMAAVITGQAPLGATEIGRLTSSVEFFKPELASLLRKK